MTTCLKCNVAGLFCGFGYTTDTKEPCVLCGTPTGVHARCGAARTGWCDPAAALTRPWAAPAPAHTSARTARQAARLQVDTAKVDADEAVSMLDALEKEYAPRRRGDDNRMRLPFWSPDQPPAMFDTYMPNGWSWARPFDGTTVTLDRVGAWVAAASSVEVAHGALTHTGDAPFAGRPGIYQVQIYPWYEQDRLPSPLGNRQGTVWVAAPMVKLLAELAEQGRWADATVLDSYTGDPCKIDKWARYANTLRCHAAAVHGRGSPGYDLVKQRYAQAINMMDGHADGVRRVWKTRVQRPDWKAAILTQATVMLWRLADEWLGAQPDHPPVALRYVDELVLPGTARDIVAGMRRRSGQPWIDPTGGQLGAFQIKDKS